VRWPPKDGQPMPTVNMLAATGRPTLELATSNLSSTAGATGSEAAGSEHNDEGTKANTRGLWTA
jgi:hypothetical protein